MASRQANILFIMSDDHAAHAISAYGSRVNRTPHIDRIADGGMRMDNCHVTNSICTPSRATFLTGQYGHVNGVRTLADTLGPDYDPQVQKLLQRAGYATAIFGKWHLGVYWGIEPGGFDDWELLPGQGEYYGPEFVTPRGRHRRCGYVTDITTDLTLEWLRRRDTSKPFFLCCHHKAPHRPWTPGPDHRDMLADEDVPEPETFDDDYAHRAEAARRACMRVDRHMTYDDLSLVPPPGTGRGKGVRIPDSLSGYTLTTDEGDRVSFDSYAQLKSFKYQRYIKDYLRCVQGIDDGVGRLLDYLDEAGIAEDTLVIYTSDQGFFLGDHGWYDKRFMYEHSLRTPLVIRYPRAIKPGSSSDAIVANHDWAPTLLDYAGVETPDAMQGRSARPILEGSVPDDWPQTIYYRYWEHLGHHVAAHYGVRDHRYKLIFYYGEGLGAGNTTKEKLTAPEWELFDLRSDPCELVSVFDDPAYAPVRDRLRGELDRLQAVYGDEPRHRPGTFRSIRE
ncbi:MAG: sulfatase [Planctomycetota bacterium]